MHTTRRGLEHSKHSVKQVYFFSPQEFCVNDSKKGSAFKQLGNKTLKPQCFQKPARAQWEERQSKGTDTQGRREGRRRRPISYRLPSSECSHRPHGQALPHRNAQSVLSAFWGFKEKLETQLFYRNCYVLNIGN